MLAILPLVTGAVQKAPFQAQHRRAGAQGGVHVAAHAYGKHTYGGIILLQGRVQVGGAGECFVALAGVAWADRHDAPQTEMLEPVKLFRKPRDLRQRNPLAVVSRDVDLQEHVKHLAGARGACLERSGRGDVLDRLHDVEQRRDAACLVALDATDEMPEDRVRRPSGP